jgi:hypothetical protein
MRLNMKKKQKKMVRMIIYRKLDFRKEPRKVITVFKFEV